jgi:sugar fermentation stimulation protein A
MKYGKIIHGRLERRINRFIAEVYIDGKKEKVHIKNTGRLKELLQPGAEVLMEYSDNPNRKTKYSLITAAKNDKWVNIDSQAPNTVVFEALKNGEVPEFTALQLVKREVTYGASRFDIYFERGEERGFIEVKGVTLEKAGTAMFPDAPTARGTKHILELIKAAREGYTAVIFFLVQMKGCSTFMPYAAMDEAFANAVRKASQEGVRILIYDCIVKEDELILDRPIPLKMQGT